MRILSVSRIQPGMLQDLVPEVLSPAMCILCNQKLLPFQYQSVRNHLVMLPQNTTKFTTSMKNLVVARRAHTTPRNRCCQDNKWYHKHCLRKIVFGKGNSLRCPTCNESLMVYKTGTSENSEDTNSEACSAQSCSSDSVTQEA